MKRLLVVSLSVIFLMGWLGFSEAAMCDGCKAMGRHEMGHGMRGIIASLGLSDTQRDAIEAIHFRCKKEAIRKRAAIAVAQIDLREITGKEPVDMTTAEAKVKEIEGIKADLRILHLRSIEEIKSKLTPEQKKKFIAMLGTGQMGEMGMMRGAGDGMMGPRGGMMGMRRHGEGRCGMQMMGTGCAGSCQGAGEPSSGAEQP